MHGKIALGAVVVLVAALLVFWCDRLIVRYGNSRFEIGRAEGQLQQISKIMAADAHAMKVALDGRDRLIAATAQQTKLITAIAATARKSDKEVIDYGHTSDGRADCLSAERVRAIDAARAALFSSPPDDNDEGDARSVLAN